MTGVRSSNAVSLDPVARRERAPYCYLRQSLWWCAESKRGYLSGTRSASYSRNLLRLYRDMIRNPEHYISWQRPKGMTDWQWSGLAMAEAV